MLRHGVVFRRASSWCGIFSLAGALLLLGTVASNAELRISGSRDSLSIEARHAPLKEILKALGKSFGVKYNAESGLEQAISGTYRGPLQRVLSRLLVGHNYVIRSSPSGMDIIILDNGSAQAANERASSQNATWQDGDGQTIAPPDDAAQFAGPTAPATWKDGDGNLIALPVNAARFAGPAAAATWEVGDGNLIARPPGH